MDAASKKTPLYAELLTSPDRVDRSHLAPPLIRHQAGPAYQTHHERAAGQVLWTLGMPLQTDLDLTAKDIGGLSSPDAVVGFFPRLGVCPVDKRRGQRMLCNIESV